MALKLKALLEGYAWERKADGSLPTLKDAIAVHEANQGSKPDFLDLDKDGNTEEPMTSAAKEMNEYGEDEFDRSSQMYGRSGGDASQLVEEIEDHVERLMQDLSTNSKVPTSEKAPMLKKLAMISDLIDQLQDEL